MGIFRKSIQALYRAFPMRTLVTNSTEVYFSNIDGGKKLIERKNETIEWKNYSDRIEIIKDNGDTTIYKTYLDNEMSRPPHINVLRFSEVHEDEYKHTYITITSDEITIGNNLEQKIIIYKVIKDTWA